MATLLQIAQLGHPVLRQKAMMVENVKSAKFQKLIDDLIVTLMDINGVGIAAPQVYESVQLFIVASHPNPRYPNAPQMVPTPIINPRIISRSKQTAKDWEGCLSVPGIRGKVTRSTKIKVEFTNRLGKIETQTYTDFIARIFLHEYDHLQGLVFLDRVVSNRDLISDKEYLKLISQKK
jgi:peptide deformylase